MQALVNKVFHKLISKLKIGEFGKNVLVMFTGVSFSQVIPIFVSPILTRLFSPSDFGLLAVFMSIVAIPSNISSLKYDSAIMLPKEDKEAINIVALSFLIISSISIITLIILMVFRNFFIDFLNNDNVFYLLVLIPFVVFITGIFQILNNWGSRKKKFKRLALRNITQTSVGAGSKLALGNLGVKTTGLIIGAIIGQVIATFTLAFQTYREDKMYLKEITFDKMKKNAIKYKNFPLFTAWQGFFDTFNLSGVSFIIKYFYSATFLGYYTFTMGLMQKPLALIGNSIAQVFYQKASNLYNEKQDLWKLVKNLSIKLASIGIIGFAPIVFFGPTIFSFVFSEKWQIAGEYARLLTPWLLMKFIVSPLTIIPQIYNKQKMFFILSLGINIISPLSIFILSIFNIDFRVILITLSLLNFLFLFVSFTWFRKLTKNL